jgi:hypothetical protein
MSEPERSMKCMSALAEVRVKRGSTWTTVEPRSWALVTHFQQMGWFSAGLLPMMRMQSLFWKSIQ